MTPLAPPPHASPDENGSPENDLALRDDLTGVYNRRYFRAVLDRDWPVWAAAGREVALLAVDLDGFKEVNDTWGHRAGDAVLQTVADVLRRNFRDGDRLIRYGGDEFVVILPGAGPAVARELAERARRALDEMSLADPDSGRPLGLTVSFSLGVASLPADGESGEVVLATADRRLYEEKRERREHPPARSRRGAARLALAAIALAAAGAATWWILRPPPLPAPVPPAPRAAAPTIPTADADEVARLRDEVAHLSAALADERRADEQRVLRERIADLEARLAAPAAAAAAAAPASTAPDPAASGGAEVPASPSAPAPGPASPTPAAGTGGSPPPVARGAETMTVEAPQLVSAPKPVYPPLARQRRREATLALEVTVDPEGRVTAAVPQGAAVGFGFEEAAIAAARQAVYRPGRRDGRPVEAKALLRIEFRLE